MRNFSTICVSDSNTTPPLTPSSIKWTTA
jgi:hypothetical protein